MNGNAAGIYFTEDNDVVYVDTSYEDGFRRADLYQSLAFAQNMTKYSASLETGNIIFVCSLTDDSPCEEYGTRTRLHDRSNEVLRPRL